MRLYLKLTPNTESVPFNYQQNLVGAFHKWIDRNEIHDEISLYSLSWLSGGKLSRRGLEFSEGSTWHISSYYNTILEKTIGGIKKDPHISFGFHVKEVIIKQTPVFSTNERFYTASPVFIKRTLNKNIKYYFPEDDESSSLLTETLKRKLDKAGIDNKGVKVQFDKS